MPLPNFDEQARAAGSTLNFVGTNDQELDSNQFLTRVDHRFNDNHRLFGRYVIVPVESNYSAEAHAMMDNQHEGQYLGTPVGLCNRTH